MRRYYLGIDLGTTCVKSILFDCHGNACGSASREYDLLFTADGVEQDANLWWTHSADTAREAVRQSGVDPKSIDAISVSTQGISGVLTDARGTPLMNALSWLDARSRVQIDQIMSFIDKKNILPFNTFRKEAFQLCLGIKHIIIITDDSIYPKRQVKPHFKGAYLPLFRLCFKNFPGIISIFSLRS